MLALQAGLKSSSFVHFETAPPRKDAAEAKDVRQPATVAEQAALEVKASQAPLASASTWIPARAMNQAPCAIFTLKADRRLVGVQDAIREACGANGSVHEAFMPVSSFTVTGLKIVAPFGIC